MVNLEAQSCGASVICYDTGGCRETDRGDIKFVRKGDWRGVFNAITCSVFKSKSNNTVNQVFDNVCYCDKYINIYEK